MSGRRKGAVNWMHRSTAMSVALVAPALVAGCPLPQKPPPAATVAGVYHVRLPAADASARVVTLWLEPGGEALLETVFVGKARLPVERGAWSADGDELTVRLDGESAPLVFGIEPERLVPRRWDHSLYGDAGLTLTRRAAYNPDKPSVFEMNQPLRVED